MRSTVRADARHSLRLGNSSLPLSHCMSTYIRVRSRETQLDFRIPSSRLSYPYLPIPMCKSSSGQKSTLAVGDPWLTITETVNLVWNIAIMAGRQHGHCCEFISHHEIVESPLEGLFLHGDCLIDVSRRGRHFVRSPKETAAFSRGCWIRSASVCFHGWRVSVAHSAGPATGELPVQGWLCCCFCSRTSDEGKCLGI